MKRGRVAAVCVVVALVAGACSGGSSGAGSTSSAPTSSAGGPGGPSGSTGSSVTGGPGPTTTERSSSKPLYDAACAGTLTVAATGTVETKTITELSGLAAMRSSKDGLWAHNDSGNDPQLFALGTDGELLATFTPKGATNIDWEDIGISPPDSAASSVYLADIGDNTKTRAQVVLYRVPEPKVTRGGTAEPRPDAVRTIDDVDTIALRYPDGPHNAEAFFIDSTNGDAVIITKEETGPARVFVAEAAELKGGATITMKETGTVSFGEGLAAQVTAADISPAGDVIAVRTYGGVHLFQRAAGQSIAQALAGKPCTGPDIPKELQGEAVGFDRDGQSYFTAAEGKNPELHQTKPR